MEQSWQRSASSREEPISYCLIFLQLLQSGSRLSPCVSSCRNWKSSSTRSSSGSCRQMLQRLDLTLPPALLHPYIWLLSLQRPCPQPVAPQSRRHLWHPWLLQPPSVVLYFSHQQHLSMDCHQLPPDPTPRQGRPQYLLRRHQRRQAAGVLQ